MDPPIEIFRAIIGNMKGLEAAFRTDGGKIGQAPNHIRIDEMGFGGVEGDISKGPPMSDVAVAIQPDGWLNLTAPVRGTICPLGQDNRRKAIQFGGLGPGIIVEPTARALRKERIEFVRIDVGGNL